MNHGMNYGILRTLALLVLLFSVPAFGQQSLGDIARQLRAERQQHGTTASPTVITNDDLEHSKSTTATAEVPADDSAVQNKDNADSSTATDKKAAKSDANAEKASSEDAATDDQKTSDKKPKSKESETEDHTKQINKEYQDRIAAIRAQIVSAQQELERIQKSQIDSTNEFRRSVGTSPSIPVYEQEQRTFNAQIAAQRDLISSLNSQLEDAQESARHAGVPHALD